MAERNMSGQGLAFQELPRQAGVVSAGPVKRGRASGEGLEGHLELSFSGWSWVARDTSGQGNPHGMGKGRGGVG